MAYLLDPGRGEVPPRGPRAALPLARAARRPIAVEGTLDLDGDAGVERDRPARRRRARGSPTRSREALDGPRARRPLRAHRAPARPRARARWKTPASASTVEFLDELRQRARRRSADALEREIHAHAGEEFNVNSTPQLRRDPVREARAHPGEEDEDRPVDRRRLAAEDGRGAPDRRDAAALPRGREAAQHLRRRAAAARSRADGRIHATFNQIATTTGRISSEAPNLQNIPVRTADGREMRRAFIADDGLRAAHRRLLADRAARARAPRRGPRAHRRVRARRRRAHHHRGEGVRRRRGRRSTTFQRRFAKVVNYGLAYGMEAYGLGQRLDIPTDQAREILDAYFDGFPNVARRTWTRRCARRRQRGYTTTIFGRRRQIPELVVRQLPHPPDGGAHGAERAGAGVGGRHLQARDDRPRPRARRRRAREPDGPHRARRARARGAARRARGGRGARARR